MNTKESYICSWGGERRNATNVGYNPALRIAEDAGTPNFKF